MLIDRRVFIWRACAAVAAVPLLPLYARSAVAQPAVDPVRGLDVRPRDDWARGLNPTGPLEPEDVRFLLVHHTASTNRYTKDDVPGLIRSFYRLHTSEEKGWPDVAYNFFVDRFGQIWEARAGSANGPVKADATGGSQGFAQLCCFIGNHQEEAPTAEAGRSMTRLLAALADAYGVDTSPGATVTFVSRGSHRWPPGTSVTTATVAGHRDMSLTECPGDAAYRLVRDVFPAEVTAALAAAAAAVPSTTSQPTSAVPATVPPTTAVPGAADGSTDVSSAQQPSSTGEDGDASLPPLALAAGGLLVSAAVGLVTLGLRRRRAEAGAPTGASSRAEAVAVTASPHPAAPSTAPGKWRVAWAPTTPAPGEPAPTATFVHRGSRALVAAIVVGQADEEVAQALASLRMRAEEIDRAPLQDRSDAAASAVRLLLEALPHISGVAVGRAHPPDTDTTLTTVTDAAVTVIRDRVCTAAATDESMAAVLTASGSVYRPRYGRVRLPAVASATLKLSCAEDEVAVIALSSPVPTGRAGRSALLVDLCHELDDRVDMGRSLDNYRYSAFGATGSEAVVIGLVHLAADRTQTSGGRE